MAENKMMVRVIAPERVFYEGEASFLEFNTIEGGGCRFRLESGDCMAYRV